MPEPIDLDLVELRCKLRGWTCRREVSPRGEPYADVTTPQYAIVFFRDGLVGYVEGAVHHVLTRPRLTLADIVASPPEGWRVGVKLEDGGLRFDFGDTALIWVTPAGKHVLVDRGIPAADMAAAHRAVADLLVLLGEVG